MFELKFIIKATRLEKRYDILSVVDAELRKAFGREIIDVSRWDQTSHPISDEFLVSVNYIARNPHTIREFIATTLRLQVVSLTHLVTKKRYPINRRKRRQQKSR